MPQMPVMKQQKKLAHHINDRRDYARAKSLRQQSTLAERLLWSHLRQLPKELSLKFRRQHPLHPYVVDFACIACQLIVEIDGISHDTRQQHDMARSHFLNGLGYTVMRFTNEAVYQNCEGVVRSIVQRAQELFQIQLATPPLTPPQGEGK